MPIMRFGILFLLSLGYLIASRGAPAQETEPSTTPSATQMEEPQDVGGGVLLYTRLTPEQNKTFLTVVLPELRKKIYRAWLTEIPEEARPPQSKAGSVQIGFTITPEGHVKGMRLQKPSGDIALDKAAWYAITGPQYTPLPRGFDGSGIRLALTFHYNQGAASSLAR